MNVDMELRKGRGRKYTHLYIAQAGNTVSNIQKMAIRIEWSSAYRNCGTLK